MAAEVQYHIQPRDHAAAAGAHRRVRMRALATAVAVQAVLLRRYVFVRQAERVVEKTFLMPIRPVFHYRFSIPRSLGFFNSVPLEALVSSSIFCICCWTFIAEKRFYG